MSASQDKKRRQLEREQGIEKHQLAQEKDQKKRAKTRRNYTIVAIIVVVLAVLIIVFTSNLFYTGTTAVEIGDEKYNAAEVNYYYKNTYYTFMESNPYAAYMIDINTPLDEQLYPTDAEDMTWADFFLDQALLSMESVTALYEQAMAEGYTLSAEKQAEIDEAIANMETQAAANGYPSVKAYLGAVYGKGCSEKLVRNLMEQSAIASKYAETVYNEPVFDAEELENYYQENRDSFDHISYGYYFVSGAADEENGIDAETAMAAAKEKAEEIAAATTDMDSLLKAAQELDEGTAQESKGAGSTIAGYSYGEWLLDDARQANDVAVTEAETGYYVMLFLDRSDNHYNTVSVRHILVEAEASEDGTYSEEAKADALARAEEILKEWQSEEATEESFAEAANTYSADAGSNTNGGLYQNIFHNAMVEEFDRFCFEPHEYGDTGIVYGETAGSYAGYHIIYYVGEGGLYSDYVAENDLRSQEYSAWETALLENYAVKENFSLRFSK